jgi:hypothetical protein
MRAYHFGDEERLMNPSGGVKSPQEAIENGVDWVRQPMLVQCPSQSRTFDGMTKWNTTNRTEKRCRFPLFFLRSFSFYRRFYPPRVAAKAQLELLVDLRHLFIASDKYFE